MIVNPTARHPAVREAAFYFMARKLAAVTAVALVLGFASQAAMAEECAVNVGVGDTLAYDVTEISAPASCGSFTVNLTHAGKMPAASMGHNWVLVPAGTEQEIAMAGVRAGAGAGYLPEDARIIAATKMLGGGEADSITFELPAAGTYAFVCTFPGHWAVMKGTFTVTG